MDTVDGQRRGEQGIPVSLDQPEQRGWRWALMLWRFSAIPFFSAFEEDDLD